MPIIFLSRKNILKVSTPSNAAVVKESLNVVYLNVSPSGMRLSLRKIYNPIYLCPISE